ncbi:MAG TPA: hypothetical protein VK694_06950 [Verrucomicrobiae bacterium]|nr:hypothetical protein [Verrucomicrobiae bacterium]
MDHPKQTLPADVTAPQQSLEQRPSPGTYRKRRVAVGAGAAAAAALGIVGGAAVVRAVAHSESSVPFEGQRTAEYTIQPGDNPTNIAERIVVNTGQDPSEVDLRPVARQLSEQIPKGQETFQPGNTADVPEAADIYADQDDVQLDHK